MVWEPGVGNSCTESLPDGSCDLRLRDGGPAPTVQEASNGRERKGDSDFPLVLPSDVLLRSPPGSRGPGTPSHPSWSSSFQGREQGERVWGRSGLKTFGMSSEARSWLTWRGITRTPWWLQRSDWIQVPGSESRKHRRRTGWHCRDLSSPSLLLWGRELLESSV